MQVHAGRSFDGGVFAGLDVRHLPSGGARAVTVVTPAWFVTWLDATGYPTPSAAPTPLPAATRPGP